MSDLFCIKPPAGLYKNNLDLSNWVIQPKLDGFRCLFISDGLTFHPISPNGKPLYNVGHIIEKLKNIPGALKYNIDGELKGENFNETSKIVRSSKKIKDGKHIKFYIFDIIDVNEYTFRKFKTKYSERYRIYKNLFSKCDDIFIVDSEKCIDNTNVWKKAQDFLNKGYEGAVIKDLDGVYKCGRSRSIQRLKFTDTVDIKITGFYEGEGKHLGKLGGVICGDNRVGSGFSDEERKNIWDNQKKFLGVTIEVKFQEKTEAGALRFPTFVRFRYDK